MKVTVKFFTSLREIVGKAKEEIELSGVVTVGELLRRLGERYGDGFVRYVYDERGVVRGHLSFLVNGEGVAARRGLRTRLRDNDVLAILPPVGGG